MRKGERESSTKAIGLSSVLVRGTNEFLRKKIVLFLLKIEKKKGKQKKTGIVGAKAKESNKKQLFIL